ncbi:porin family protein [Photobacterium japonica]|uniref:outer membrane protein n=1 Tax=Photobacterium japonica TaxID=2910235 RepID=UPI003D127327
MKKLLLVSLLFSNCAFAGDHFYGGADLALGNKTELKEAGSIDETNDLGFNVYGGYSFTMAPSVDLGLELEYQNFGQAKFSGSAEGLSVDGDAYYVNFRPKFTAPDNNLYSAFIFGAGTMNGEAKVLGQSGSDSKFTYQAGVEVGYMFNNVDVGIGYRYRTADFDDVKYSVQGFTAGVRYNF